MSFFQTEMVSHTLPMRVYKFNYKRPFKVNILCKVAQALKFFAHLSYLRCFEIPKTDTSTLQPEWYEIVHLHLSSIGIWTNSSSARSTVPYQCCLTSVLNWNKWILHCRATGRDSRHREPETCIFLKYLTTHKKIIARVRTIFVEIPLKQQQRQQKQEQQQQQQRRQPQQQQQQLQQQRRQQQQQQQRQQQQQQQ